MSVSIFTLKEKLLKSEALANSYDFAKVGIASAEKIRKWAQRELPNGKVVGELANSASVDFLAKNAEVGGLFCEQIFGPLKNWKCQCGKYRGVALNKICEQCSVELTEARVRRYRMAHISLIYPVCHFWYLDSNFNLLLDLLRLVMPTIESKHLESVLYFKNEVDMKFNPLKIVALKKEESFDEEFRALIQDKQSDKFFRGAEIILHVLQNMDLKSYIENIRDSKKPNTRILRILENFQATETKLSSLLLTVIPVLPPSLRPILEMEDNLIAADLNEIYKTIIERNAFLVSYLEEGLPYPPLSRSLRRGLQEIVDCLIDNARVNADSMFLINDRPVKTLTELLEGKEGRFRQTLLGKRVDYSARSVIIPEPQLKINQCGIPFEIALELFKPSILDVLARELKFEEEDSNIKLQAATQIFEQNESLIWELLVKLMCTKTVLLNRAPTLHKFGVQAFQPIPILGRAIMLHPLVCTGFNADFDGDQMAVHLPLSEVSQLECRALMRSSTNMFSSSDGKILLKPTQDIVIGCYYLSLLSKKESLSSIKIFPSEEHALAAFASKKLTIHSKVLVRYNLNNFQIQGYKVGNSTRLKIKSLSETKISLLKVIKVNKDSATVYALTNVGILVAEVLPVKREPCYKLRFIFLETTVGRILFANKIKII